MNFDFSSVPRHWFYGSAWVTHVANGLHLVFPAGERFFIRSVKHYLDQIDDPKLLTRVRAFFGQEGAHGHQHEASFRILEAQGFEVQPWLDWYEKLAFETIEPRVPPNIRLAVTVALEHYTATLAEQGLTTEFIDHAHPVMQQLLKWHAAEEIEHKSVAFDVLQHVDDRYWVRVVGLVIATWGLLYFWRKGTQMLLEQENLEPGQILRERREAAERGQNNDFLRKAILGYLRRDFHPDQHDNYPIAREYLESIGRLAA